MTGILEEVKSKPALFPVNPTTFQPYNQLKFSLENSKTSHDSFKVGPIIIEKLGSNFYNGKNIKSDTCILNFQPKIISQERLDIACTLARQDFENKRLLEKFSIYSATELENHESPRNNYQKDVHQDSSSSREMCVKDLTKSSEIQLKEPKKKILSKKTKLPKNSVSWDDLRHTDAIRSNSVRTVNLNNPQIEEIQRLRRSLFEYVDKIDNLVRQAILQNEFQIENEDDAEMKQKTARAVEQAIRSARILYALEQQVKKIQQQIIVSSTGKTKHTAKAAALFRLISVHRSALQIVQFFVKSLPYLGIHQNLPHVYHKLANFLYQLTLCCIHLDIERDSGFPNLKLYPLLMKQQRMIIKKKTKPNWDSSSTSNVVIPKSPTSREFISDKGTSEESIDLKHFIEQLMEKKKQERNKMVIKLMNSKRVGKAKGAGALISNRFKYGRPQKPGFSKPSFSNSNYTRSTHSSNLKSISSKESNIICERENSGPQFLDNIPKCICLHSSKLKDSERIGNCKPSIVNKVSFKNNKTRKSHTNDVRIQSPIKKATTTVQFMEPVIAEQGNLSTENASSERSWSDRKNAEGKVITQKSLQPLIDKTEQLISKQELLTDYFEEFKNQLQEKTGHKKLLSTEVQSKARSNDRHIKSSTLSQLASTSSCPSLNAIIQRIQEMEETENEIRKRWGSIKYSDPKYMSQYRSISRMDTVPKLPSPIILIKDNEQTKMKKREKQTDVKLSFSGNESPEVLLYTKPKSAEKSVFVTSDLSTSKIPEKTSLDLPWQQKLNILKYKKEYEKHLKRTSHFASESFNPWQFVQEVADEVLDDAIEDVATELSDVCSDVVEQIFKDEFNLPSEPKSKVETLPKQ